MLLELSNKEVVYLLEVLESKAEPESVRLKQELKSLKTQFDLKGEEDTEARTSKLIENAKEVSDKDFDKSLAE